MGKADKSGVGVFLIGGFILFAIGLFMIGNRQQLFTESIETYAEFKNLAGLQNGATVRVSGADAGRVLTIEPPATPEGKFRVHFRVVEDLLPIMRTDSVASIQTDGIVGNMYLEVGAGSSAAPSISDGAGVSSVEPFQIADFLDQTKEIVATAEEVLDQVKTDLKTVATNVNDIAEQAEGLVSDARPSFQALVVSAKNIAEDADALVSSIEAGEGTVGKLFREDDVYNTLKSTTDNLQRISADLAKMSDTAGGMMETAREKDLMGDLDKTVENVRDMTAKANEMLDSLKAEGDDGQPSMTDDVRQTMASANEAMTDFAENAEALKRNFFFKGFFKKRGFYDLSEISVADYKAGEKAPGYPLDRVWLHANDLFVPNSELLKISDDGKRVIDAAFADFIEYAKDDPILVEGYAGLDNAADAYLLSQRRSAAVRAYLLEKYGLKPNYVGVMEMGRVESTAPSGKPWDGVALVRFLDKKEMKARDKAQKK
jgi:phospholipid/cholesterol/gamma-HCH transport system substrate-binding protein